MAKHLLFIVILIFTHSIGTISLRQLNDQAKCITEKCLKREIANEKNDLCILAQFDNKLMRTKIKSLRNRVTHCVTSLRQRK